MTALAALRGRLDAVPMVRVVLAALVVLSAAAVLGSLPGWVPFPTASLAAVLVVAVGVSWLSTRAAAALTRSSAHDASALVTGLLLFLILYPSAAPLDLLLVAAAALLATASKYLIRVGGRHVLNPAAAGLFLVGLTGLAGSAWWVATPVLAPLTGLLGLVIAVRLRLLAPVVLLVAAGAVLQVVATAVSGFPAGQAAAAALVTTPLVFLAGFMFTEPITLPPRPGQRLVEAVVVAVLLALPYLGSFSLGTLHPTPELALLLGNVLALALARPAAAGLRLVGSRRLSPTAVEYAFRPDRPLRHRAGQYLELQLPHRGADRRGARRSLTIVSAPDEPDGAVRVAVRTGVPGSSFKRALDELPEGGRGRAVTVSGGFTLPTDRGVPLLLVGSGIGITPFVSQLRHDRALVDAGAPARDVVLIDRVPAADDVPYLAELAATGVPVVLVCPDPGALPPLPDHWRAVDRFDADVLADAVAAPARRTAYVSGSPRFVARARGVLRRLGVRRVRTDAFAGY